MKTFTLGRYSRHVLDRLVDDAPAKSAVLTLEHRASLGARLSRLGHGSAPSPRRVERRARRDARARTSGGRRVRHGASLGNAALRRAVDDARLTTANAVELGSDQMLRAASGYSRSGSLASNWLASAPHPRCIGLVTAEAANWATQLAEITTWLDAPVGRSPTSDAYYDVASARTTLARVAATSSSVATSHRVILRVRSGAPGKSAGPGLRADLTDRRAADHGGGRAACATSASGPRRESVCRSTARWRTCAAGARDLVRTRRGAATSRNAARRISLGSRGTRVALMGHAPENFP